ncbi:MAG TPA: DsbA family protein [Candidatus Paceibacterota bacterium]|nr:DsbA family protein [Candidatus Paceibacterota bacterium]
MDDQPQIPLTKKERREQRRQDARGEQSSASRRRVLKRVLLWVIVLGVLAGGAWGLYKASERAAVPAGDGTLAVAVTDDENIRGPVDAPVTLVEYSDLQCPACKAFHPVLQQLMEDSGGTVRLVYRHFPIRNIHANADLAARAAEAAGLQGKFWEMHDRIFDEQGTWSGRSSQGARDAFLSYAQELGLDTARLEADMDSDAVKDAVQADLDGALAAGVNATPTFFLNGAQMTGLTSLEDFLSRVLNAAPPTP